MLLRRRCLQFRAFFGQNCALNRTDFDADATVDAGVKVDPVPVGSLLIFSGAFVDAGDRAVVGTGGNAFANVGHDRMRHGFFFRSSSVLPLSLAGRDR